MKKKWIIMISICLIVIILFFLYLFVMRDKKHYEINKSVDIVIGGYDQVVKVLSLDKDVIVDNERYSGKYIKIELEIENKKDIDSITALHQFALVDKSNIEQTDCYHESILPDSGITDIFPSKILAKNKTYGYLYCPIISDISKLKITVISGGKIESDNKIVYEYKDYYLDLG